jgi:hypothetical protein
MRAHVLGTAPILANFINASALGGAGEAAAPTGTRA